MAFSRASTTSPTAMARAPPEPPSPVMTVTIGHPQAGHEARWSWRWPPPGHAPRTPRRARRRACPRRSRWAGPAAPRGASGASPCDSHPDGACRSCAGCSPPPRRPSGDPRTRCAGRRAWRSPPTMASSSPNSRSPWSSMTSSAMRPSSSRVCGRRTLRASWTRAQTRSRICGLVRRLPSPRVAPTPAWPRSAVSHASRPGRSCRRSGGRQLPGRVQPARRPSPRRPGTTDSRPGAGSAAGR